MALKRWRCGLTVSLKDCTLSSLYKVTVQPFFLAKYILNKSKTLMA